MNDRPVWLTTPEAFPDEWTTPTVASLVGRAWQVGREAGLNERVAADVAELDATWKARGRTSYAAKVAARIAEMAAQAAAGYARLGYPAGYEYRGGPVDYQASLPVGSACAWLRRTRADIGLSRRAA